MKKTNLIIRVLAAALVLCFSLVMLAGCGNGDGKTVMTFAKDGKTVSISEKEFSLLMKVMKAEFFCSNYVTSASDTASLWVTQTTDENPVTYETLNKDLIVKLAKTAAVEKLLFAEAGLTLPQETIDNCKQLIKKAEANHGGSGFYKKYYGFSASDFYNIYIPMLLRTTMVNEELCKDGGICDATAEDLQTYYEDNYIGFQFILLDMENKVERDEEGNRIIATTKNAAGETVDATYYKTSALTDDEKSEKQVLAETILAELEAGNKTFEEMVQEYSDAYYSITLKDGVYVEKEGSDFAADILKAVNELEIGEYHKKVIDVDSGKYQYIVKRVALKDKVYDAEVCPEYKDFFATYRDGIETNKYNAHIESFFEGIEVDMATINTYTMADTYLSTYVDDYFYALYNGQEIYDYGY